MQANPVSQSELGHPFKSLSSQWLRQSWSPLGPPFEILDRQVISTWRLGSNQCPPLCEGNGIAPNGHTSRDTGGTKRGAEQVFRPTSTLGGPTQDRDVWRP